MAGAAAMLTWVALAGALASWIAGAIFYAQLRRERGSAVRWLAILAWPVARSGLRDAAEIHASLINKAVVALIACLLVAGSAWSVAANLHRFAR